MAAPMRTAALALCLLLFGRGVSSSLMDYQNRMEFIQKMDEETRQRTRHAQEFQRRLVEKARPVTNDGRILDQQQYDDDQNAENKLDLENYALKYAGCQNIKTFSDNLAQDEDSDTVFATERFVVFRMCPADHCNTHNSHGCNSNYGEYMITMEDYLAIMAQYHYARYHEFCATCKACMTYQEQASYQDKQEQQDGDRKLNNYARHLANDDAYGNDAYGDDANGNDAYADDAYNDDAAAAYQDDDAYAGYFDDDYATADDVIYGNDDATDDAATDDFYAFVDDDLYKDDDSAGGKSYNCGLSTCYNYESVCEDYTENTQDLSNYFACSQFVVGNQAVYIGPHCNDDGHGITLGLFEDYGCSSYLGSIADREEFTGIAFNDNSLSFYYPKTCVSCANQGEWTLQNDNSGGDAHAYEFCEALYDASAKCHQYLSSSSSVYESENQEETDGSVCNFIQSLEENHYDEDGEINLSNLYFDVSKWTDYHQYTKIVSPAQIFGLVASICLFLGLLIYSCCLHNALTQKSRARKSRRDYKSSLLYHGQVPGQISPSYSGITRHRSHDSGSAAKTWASNESKTSSKNKTWPKHESLATSSGSSSSQPSSDSFS